MNSKWKLLIFSFIVLITMGGIILGAVKHMMQNQLSPQLQAVEKPQLDLDALPKLVFAFYYPWYGTPEVSGEWFHWNNEGHNPENITDGRRDINAPHYPLQGAYDSKNRSLIAWHFKLAEEAGIDVFICSWWGFGKFSDEAFKIILDVAEEINTHIKLTVYVEIAADREGTVAMLEKILKDYGERDSFFKIQGYPVIFIYSRAVNTLSLEDWDYVVRKIRYDGYKALFIADISWNVNKALKVSKIFDGIYSYNPYGRLKQNKNLAEDYASLKEVADEEKVIFAATVLPGFDKPSTGSFYPRNNGETYNKTWEAAVNSGAKWILICTWNEWHEGSEIEPSLEYGYQYINLTAHHLSLIHI